MINRIVLINHIECHMVPEEKFSRTNRLPAIKGVTAAGRIVEHIRTELLAGRLEPGKSLGTEGEFAQRFGVSRSVARDALKGLEAIGVVEKFGPAPVGELQSPAVIRIITRTH